MTTTELLLTVIRLADGADVEYSSIQERCAGFVQIDGVRTHQARQRMVTYLERAGYGVDALTAESLVAWADAA